MTAAANLKKRAERGMRKSNPGAKLTIEWNGRTRRVEYPTGYIGLEARGTIRAEGYATASITVTANLDGSEMMARTWSARDTYNLVAPMLGGRA